MTSTPTGVPIIQCGTCNRTHPQGRAHCTQCGQASLFLAHGKCRNCQRHNNQEDQ
ncbi:hypothetical protein [Jonesia denitrificans]|uniref:Uncharacterized protein n=1 Tax=Jonesia denitrificans (strain ATCC 14870 / DSM 20603 / BCRC 15368 / CIP 55.134 / JCM 11481 / NBRC 15587 / NCTC 10816 / Prevot 55134) TaxID=471856 RepID=C7R247_JONDD|nr:hypothetical protein [Jonesia denitrificans]ACV09935.1 hypothetical protein Jden_2300 [Jonesia denitrificans DSM 20603]QXB43431.1 hypothetical protein I6L70_00475 [Jonesia denitrificans]SQH22683.1 Uncharacterised protein [Jonesia denitrificans]